MVSRDWRIFIANVINVSVDLLPIRISFQQIDAIKIAQTCSPSDFYTFCLKQIDFISFMHNKDGETIKCLFSLLRIAI